MKLSRFLGLFLGIFTLTLYACGSGATVGGPVPVATAAGAASPVATGGGTVTSSPKASSAPTVSPAPTPSSPALPSASPTATALATAAPTTLPAGEKIYVVNHGQLGDNPSVTIYPVAATGAATPVATIAGPSTALGQPFFDAVDAAGTLYVSNQSNAPISPTAGYVTEYAAMDQSGNVAPVRTITGLHNPEGLAVDGQGDLYVAVTDAVDVFAPGASGNATPIRVIGGSSTTLQNLLLGGQPAGIALDGAGDVFVAMGPAILEFAANATGNVAPINVYGGTPPGSDPATTGPPYGSTILASCLGVGVDAAGDVYAANFNNSTFALFASAAAPGVPIVSTGADMPFGLFVDSSGEVYAANYKNSTVQIFSSMATFTTGLATATISGTATNLNFPYGVTAR